MASSPSISLSTPASCCDSGLPASWGNGREAAIRRNRIARRRTEVGEDIDISLLEHVSPIEWENVILYGQYVLNSDDIR